jgi:hypothetical protein
MLGIIGPIALLLILCFGFVLAFGAPYLPTLDKQVRTALELAGLKRGQSLLELGCGDGKVLIAAAQRGVQVTGFELNPLLVVVCKLRCWRYRQLVTVRWANFWTTTWPATDVIFIFGLPRIMQRLDAKIDHDVTKPARLVSFAFAIPNRKPTAERDGVFRYDYSPKAKA